MTTAHQPSMPARGDPPMQQRLPRGIVATTEAPAALDRIKVVL
jgi:hypothetical protein